MNVQSKPVAAGDAPTMVPLGEDYPEIREGVKAICAKYPGEYWRKLEENDEYAEEFVKELRRCRLSRRADPGGIWRRGPAAARGLRDPRGDPRLGRQRRGVSCADVHDGHDAPPRQRGAEAPLPSRHRCRQDPLPGLRRDRADHRLRHHASSRPAPIRKGDQLCRQRPEDLDLARAQVRPDDAAGAHHAARRGEAAHRGLVGAARRHARTAHRQGPDHAAHRDHDQSPDQRGVLRRSAKCRRRT